MAVPGPGAPWALRSNGTYVTNGTNEPPHKSHESQHPLTAPSAFRSAHASIRRCVLLAPASLTAFPDLWQNPTRVAQEVSVYCYLLDPRSGRV